MQLLAGYIWPQDPRSRRCYFGETPTFTPLLTREKIAYMAPETQENYVRRAKGGAENERGWRLTTRETIATGFFDTELLHQKPNESQWARVGQLKCEWRLESLATREISTSFAARRSRKRFR